MITLAGNVCLVDLVLAVLSANYGFSTAGFCTEKKNIEIYGILSISFRQFLLKISELMQAGALVINILV